ncbi:DNA replication/checkpoint protein [Corynascus similis CBS 632.67]
MPHKIMDGQTKAAYESQSHQLRADLKKWESDWALAHEGRKPSRDDIKQRPDIGKIPPPPPGPAEATHQQHQRKRTQSDAALHPQTPSKKSRPAQTPKKTRHFQSEAIHAGARTPSAAHAATPSADRASLTPAAAVPTSISPTPQKDGRVLGLFDLLGRTPSGSSAAPVPIAMTPSKQRAVGASSHAAAPTITAITPTTARFATTPQSKRASTQRLFQTTATTSATLDDKENNHTTLFKTPSTNRVFDGKPNVNTTPTSATPSFLRRRTVSMGALTTTGGRTGLARVDEQDENGGNGGTREIDNDEEEEESWRKVGPLRLPRKLGIGRSLSSVVAGLRKMEDEAFGDEEEVLREMEMAGQNATPAAAGMVRKGAAELKDSQADPQGQAEEPRIGLLSGFDEEELYDSLEEDEQRAQQQPLRQFKKRGQKRTTRLVKMRPTRAKRPSQPGGGGEDQEEEEADDVVPETQLDASSKPSIAAGNDLRLLEHGSASEADFDASDPEDDDDDHEKRQDKTRRTRKPGSATDKSKTGGDGVPREVRGAIA